MADRPFMRDELSMRDEQWGILQGRLFSAKDLAALYGRDIRTIQRWMTEGRWTVKIIDDRGTRRVAGHEVVRHLNALPEIERRKLARHHAA